MAGDVRHLQAGGMSALVLDAGALAAVDRRDRAMLARLRIAQQGGLELRSTGVVISHVWRDRAGRQANLARFLRSVDVKAVDQRLGREAGVLLGRAGTQDAVDASVVAVSRAGDRILTSDPDDIAPLVAVSQRSILIVDC
ncbi:MAG: twitching motility protein PilT [Solirubrobacteraceae bacterium]